MTRQRRATRALESRSAGGARSRQARARGAGLSDGTRASGARSRSPLHEREDALGSGRRFASDEVLTFMRLLRAVEQRVRGISKRMRSPLGVTGSEQLILRMIGRYPGLSSGELARLLHLSASTLTGVIERLVQRKLLARRTDARDRRRDVLDLTPAGRRADRVRTGTVEAYLERALANLSPREIATASGVLQTLARELARP